VRQRHLDGIRALAACYVVLQHVWLTALPIGSAAGDVTHWWVYGNYAVTAFVVLSGYCLVLAGPERFLWRRARRLLPPYWVALALCWWLAATLLRHPGFTVWRTVLPAAPLRDDVVLQALLLQDLTNVHLANYVFWSIAVEAHVYAVFPLAIRVRRLLPWALAVAALAYAALVATGTRTGVDRLHPQFYAFFLLGMWACRTSWAPRLAWLVPLCLAGLVAVNLALPSGEIARNYAYTQPFVAVATLAVLLDAKRPGSRVAGWLSWRPLVRVGLVAYSLYLVHAPLLEMSWRWLVRPLDLSPGLSLFALLLAGGGVSLLGAFGFYRLVERPFLRERTRLAHDEAAAA
jgi:peptidoglycan/LPS O-acetylase OafA/YrhL